MGTINKKELFAKFLDQVVFGPPNVQAQVKENSLFHFLGVTLVPCDAEKFGDPLCKDGELLRPIETPESVCMKCFGAQTKDEKSAALVSLCFHMFDKDVFCRRDVTR